MLFNFYVFAETSSSCFFFFLLFIELYLLIPAVIAQICNHIADFIIPVAISTKEAKAEMEIHQVTAKVHTLK